MYQILSLTFLFYELKSFKKENTNVLVIIWIKSPNSENTHILWYCNDFVFKRCSSLMKLSLILSLRNMGLLSGEDCAEPMISNSTSPKLFIYLPPSVASQGLWMFMKLEVILLITMGNTPFSLIECLVERRTWELD